MEIWQHIWEMKDQLKVAIWHVTGHQKGDSPEVRANAWMDSLTHPSNIGSLEEIRMAHAFAHKGGKGLQRQLQQEGNSATESEVQQATEECPTCSTHKQSLYPRTRQADA